jgi:hypothetical protein
MAVTWPLAARAQQAAMQVVGFLSSIFEETFILAAWPFQTRPRRGPERENRMSLCARPPT